MCGRYSLSFEILELMEYIHQSFPNQKINWKKSYNIAPSQEVPVLLKENNELKIKLMNWGLKLGSYFTINARSETLFQKPLFRHAAKNHCAIAATSFFEWKKLDSKNKQPYLLKLKNQRLFYFAGIYLGDHCCIVTTSAKKEIESIHHRMPVILKEDEMDQWLDSSDQKIDLLKEIFSNTKDLCFEFYPVSKAVNAPQNNDERILDQTEIQEAQAPQLGLFDSK